MQRIDFLTFWRGNRRQLFIVAIGLHIIFWVLWAIFIRPFPISFNIPFSITAGPVTAAIRNYILPITGLVFLLINFFLALVTFSKERLVSYFFIGLAIFAQVFLVFFGIYLIFLN